MVEVERNVLRAKLGELTRLAAFLRSSLPPTAGDLRADMRTELAVLHAVQLAGQIVCDVALNVGAAEGFGVAADYRSAVRELGARGVLPLDLAGHLEALAGMRNLIVHQYERVDLEKLHAACATDLDDLDRFAVTIAERYGL